MIGVDRVERIFVGIQAVGHMPRIDGRFAEVAGAVYILEIGPVTRLVEGYRGGKSNPDALLLAARLGRNDDGAVGGARSVKRRCSRAFQHRDRLHVVGIDVTGAIAVVDRGVVRFVRTRRRIGIHTAADGHTVDHEQSRIVVIRERALAAQRDTDRSAGSCGRLVEIQTGNLTGHTAQPTAAGIVGDVVGADLRDGIAEALLLTGDTEGRHHHVLDAVGRRPELEVDTRTGVHRLRHRIVTQIGTDNFAVCRNIQRIFAVGAGAHTEGRTLDDQRRTDERHAVGITHRTGYFHIGTGLVGRLAHEHDLCSPHCSRHLGDRLRDDRLDGGVGHAERDPAGGIEIRNVIHESVAALLFDGLQQLFYRNILDVKRQFTVARRGRRHCNGSSSDHQRQQNRQDTPQTATGTVRPFLNGSLKFQGNKVFECTKKGSHVPDNRRLRPPEKA